MSTSGAGVAWAAWSSHRRATVRSRRSWRATNKSQQPRRSIISSRSCAIAWRQFFFSSRRGHTRSYGDWSSDVCSSDLRSEQGEQSVAGEAFYLPMNAPPEFFGVLARALLKAPNHKLQLLPAGETVIEGAATVTIGRSELTEYRITGLGISPQPIWLDRNGTSASVSPWVSVVPDGA